MRSAIRAALCALAFLCVARAGGAAQPAEWAVDPDASTIVFTTRIDGKETTGRFERMRGTGVFREDAPVESRFALDVVVESLELGDAMAEAFAIGPAWFDHAAWPTVRYRLARLEPREDGLWEALGDLTVRGETRVFRTPLALEIGPDEARARGTVAFDRREFGLSNRAVELIIDIAPEVGVSFDLIARPLQAE